MENSKEIKQAREDASSTDEQSIIEQETRAKWETLRPSFLAWAAQNGESPSAFDDIVEGQVEFARVHYQKQRAKLELGELSTRWDNITPGDARSLQTLLDTNPQEASMHCFFEDNPKFLIQVLTGGHGRYQLSKKRLGAEYVPDFLIAEGSSIGIEWYAVELESPRCKVHRTDGNPAEPLNTAIAQIRDWRQWLINNLDYARRPKDQDGLGLIGIDSRVPGLIIIGRRHQYPKRFNDFRRQMKDRESILIHSYDWLTDIACSNRSGSLDFERRETNFDFGES
jgi:hypothetical protein